jgi:hypothetical protein
VGVDPAHSPCKPCDSAEAVRSGKLKLAVLKANVLVWALTHVPPLPPLFCGRVARFCGELGPAQDVRDWGASGGGVDHRGFAFHELTIPFLLSRNKPGNRPAYVRETALLMFYRVDAGLNVAVNNCD